MLMLKFILWLIFRMREPSHRTSGREKEGKNKSMGWERKIAVFLVGGREKFKIINRLLNTTSRTQLKAITFVNISKENV